MTPVYVGRNPDHRTSGPVGDRRLKVARRIRLESPPPPQRGRITHARRDEPPTPRPVRCSSPLCCVIGHARGLRWTGARRRRPPSPHRERPPPRRRPAPSGSGSLGRGQIPTPAAALDAFRAFVQTEQAFHLAGDMLMKVGDLTLQAAIVSDVAKGDEQGTIDLRGPGVSIRLVDRPRRRHGLPAGGEPRLADLAGGKGAFSNPLGGLAVEGLEADRHRRCRAASRPTTSASRTRRASTARR